MQPHQDLEARVGIELKALWAKEFDPLAVAGYQLYYFARIARWAKRLSGLPTLLFSGHFWPR
jgi:hypothetical protein